MEVIDEILTSATKSDFQNDYLQLNALLSKKKEYLFGMASEISSHNDQANSSKDFKKPNRKHMAKANFISGNAENVKTITDNKYATLSTAVTDESEETVIVERKLPPIMVKPQSNLQEMLKKFDEACER
ncbi:hypothetical protein CEXT_611031 [Caerostris extrusa]|uniref:Uncharacterized protein n=1 Tax=Caerostris extrusa TaxID=172846 RepID=A0AAV4X3I8_CAEEX|nr:hypothetical protein CEXT_611031 [Caerostris extrusa]